MVCRLVFIPIAMDKTVSHMFSLFMAVSYIGNSCSCLDPVPAPGADATSGSSGGDCP